MEDKELSYSPVIKQFWAIKEEYKDCILFFRLGDFYELFFEDAVTGSKELDLVLTGKDCGTDKRAPMCGVPAHAYESYAQKLIEKGYKVAICEQTDTIINKVMQREVVRVITPGTVMDSSMLQDSSNTYIMCIYKNKSTISYAYADLSTGEINVAEYSGKDVKSYINDQIVRVSPSEIICNAEMKELSVLLPCVISNSNIKFNEYYDWAFTINNAEKIVCRQYGLRSLNGYDFDSKNCIIAVGAMLEYFKETQKRDLKHLKLPRVLQDNQFMYIDTNTRRNLEIELTMRNATKSGSLLWVLDDTCTNGGARLLKNWVRQPLQNKTEIEKRLNMVEELYLNNLIRAELNKTLSSIQDIERIVGKIAYGNLMPKDCIALANSLRQTMHVKRALLTSRNENIIALANQIEDTTSIANFINATIEDEPPALMKDGGYIKSGFNPALDRARNIRANAENYILQLQQHEREETGIKNLKIGYNRVFGYYIEVNKSMNELVPFRYIRKQTLSNNERYITEELKQFEEEVLNSKQEAEKLEEEIYKNFKAQLLENAKVMQQVASAVAVADCIYSLAETAVKNDYCKPTITNNKEIKIVAGRHPIVERMARGEDFIPNDCVLNDNEQRTMILTGPNMAGKSTYMRQVALITYMAHIGSFVPAKSADICLVDRIFTRIGASDDLSVGQSTFMVEMIEVANILNYATNNSLIILDEVGRGTSTFDGLSIAWSVVEYLSKKLNVKTMFATHYHELMQLESLYDGVKNYCISIKEIGGKLVFLRKIMRGSATRSYGIEVASLAGLPNEVINRSKELIAELENEKIGNNQQKESEILDNLRSIDINTLTPLVAFDTLNHLINLSK